MDNLIATAWPDGFWPSIIKIFSFIGNYAWIIIVFTIVLKLVLSPLDFAQRYYSNKTSRMQAKIQPQLEKLKKQYGQNTALLYQKQNELYQKNGVSNRGSCIFMLIYLVLTMVIFFSLFSSLQYISRYNIQDQYNNLQNTYYTSYNSEYVSDYLGQDITGHETKIYTAEEIATFEGEKKQSLIDGGMTEDEALQDIGTNRSTSIDNAQNDVVEEYKVTKDSWLWIKNIYISDNPTVTSVLSFDQYKSVTGDNTVAASSYNVVMYKLLNNEQNLNGANGYFILSILVLLVSFLSQFILRKTTQQKDKNGNKIPMPTSSKVMMLIMPVLMVMFTIRSSAIFSIYILTNSLVSTILSPITIAIANKIENKREKIEQEKIKVDYRR